MERGIRRRKWDNEGGVREVRSKFLAAALVLKMVKLDEKSVCQNSSFLRGSR